MDDGKIFVEDSKILMQQHYAENQYHLRLHAPRIAELATAGQFVHLRCGTLPMRRPMSIMLANDQSIDILYKVHGQGTALLAHQKIGDVVSIIGPIGRSFSLDKKRSKPLLLGGGVGIPPMVFMAQQLKTIKALNPLVLIGSEVPFPFQARPSQCIVPHIPNEVTAAMPLLDDWQVPSRLANGQAFAGCFKGNVVDLAKLWLDGLSLKGREQVQLFACGPNGMLHAVSRLARSYQLPCQLALEEYMACAVGGCAGCTVLIEVAGKQMMKRVCVDGPVFDYDQIVMYRS